MRYSAVLFSFGFLALWLPVVAQQHEPLYGLPQQQVYRNNKVKEIRVEVEQFSNEKVIHLRHVHQRHLIDENGHITRSDYSTLTTQKMWTRSDSVFSGKGVPVSTTTYGRDLTPGANADSIPINEIRWMPYERIRFSDSGKQKEALDRWNESTKKWEEVSTFKTYQKNDTTYTLEQELKYPARELTRVYKLKNRPDITRTDRVTFRIHTHYGESIYYYTKKDPDFYYTRTKNGKVVETGQVDFEMELHYHLEKNPQDARGLLSSERKGNALLDKVSRLYPGTLKPYQTFTYDKQGQLMERKTKYGQTDTYLRDPQGKVVKKTTQTESGGSQTITYTYNANGLLEREENLVDGKPEENRYYQYSFY